MNNEMRFLLLSFYSQLNHQPLAFTAMGMYRISLSFLGSILTGIVSYQIILVQFHDKSI